MLSFPQADFKIKLAGLLASLLLILAVSALAAGPEPVLYRGTIAAFQLNIRSGPSQAADVVATLEKGTEVDVIHEEGGIGGWLTVIYQGQQGFVRNRPQYITLMSVTGEVAAAAPPKTIAPKTEKPDTQVERQKEAIAEKLEDENRKMARFSEKEAEILDGLNEIDYSLNQARVRAHALTVELEKLTAQIEAIKGETESLNRSMAEVQAYAGQRLQALYRMQMIGSLEMAGPPSSLFDFMVKQKAMKKVVTSDYTLMAALSRDLEQLNLLRSDLEKQIQAKTLVESDLALQIRIKEKESDKKETILREIREKKLLSEATLASLKSAAESLEKRLDAMGLSGSPALDDESFERQKGLLPVPVDGTVISSFGPSKNGDYNAFTFQSGIDIKVERGEPVRSVFKGEVMFSDWLKGYGNLMIINHGDNYYTLYAHVEEMFKKKGEAVGTGEVIATAGDTGSIKGMCLHFEVRHHGKPVNPMTWLKKGA